jgi:adiponectin receptor
MSVMPSVDALRSRLFDFGPSAATAAAEMRVQVELAPLSYIPRLKAHLTRLQAHMEALSSCFSSRSDQPLSPSGGSFPFHISITPPKIVTELLAALLEKDTEEAIEADIQKAKEDEETMHEQVKRLLLKSDFGKTLVRYEDLPVKWRNNEFVLTGYRLAYFAYFCSSSLTSCCCQIYSSPFLARFALLRFPTTQRNK